MDTLVSPLEVRLLRNPQARRDEAKYTEKRKRILSIAAGERARDVISAWPDYEPTPLVLLNGMAARLGIRQLIYKDESLRFGLGSFKALGGAYAVFRLLQQQLSAQGFGSAVPIEDLRSGRYRDALSEITVCCATDGNHGRSVAWGARAFGCKSVVFLHEDVSPAREAAIAVYGARVIRVKGNYDDSVHAAKVEAERRKWFVVADTSYPGYTDVPRDVMQGYSVMLLEAELQGICDLELTHIFIQGGVGGLAASVCAHFWERDGVGRPQIIVVEPAAADCLFASTLAGKPTAVRGELNTVMAGLACGEVSLLAWDILDEGADFFMTIQDDAALGTMRALADPVGNDPPLVAGESGAAGLAGLMAAANDTELRQLLGIGPAASVLVIGTEGDTDPAFYEKTVGRTAAEVRAISLG